MIASSGTSISSTYSIGTAASFIASACGIVRGRLLEIGGRIDAGRRRPGRNFDDDFVAVPERSQLLERFEPLDRRAFERWIARQKVDAIRVEAVVTIKRQIGRQRAHGRPE